MPDDYTEDMDSKNAEVVEHDFAQLEHVNQIIYDNMQHKGWECFDTAELLKEHPEYGSYNSNNPSKSKVNHNVVDVRYNSLIVNIDVTNDGYYVYDFEVRNALWDGTYKITRSKNSSEDEDVLFPDDTVDITSPDKTNRLKIAVNGDTDDIKDIRVCFHMQMDGEGRTIHETSLTIDHEKEFTDQYHLEVKHSGYVYDEMGNPAKNVTVRISPCDEHGFLLEDGIAKASTTTNSNGSFTLPYSAVERPGVYYVLLKATRNTLETSMVVKINKVQDYQITHLWGVDSDYEVYKGRIHKYEMEFMVINEFGLRDESLTSELAGIPVNVTSTQETGEGQTVTCILDKEGYIYPEISYRGMYDEKTTLSVNVPATTKFPDIYSSKREVVHPWYIAETFKDSTRKVNDIVTETNDIRGTDFIMIKAGTYIITETIQTKRDLTYCGMVGEERVLMEGTTNKGEKNEERHTIVRITDEDASKDKLINVNFYGLAFMDANCAILIRDGCDVTVDNCYFHENKYNSTMNGVSIHQVTTDETHKNSDLYHLLVQNSMFYNNWGTEIMSIGNTEIYNNLFRTGNRSMADNDTDNKGWEYLRQPNAKVCSVHAGEVTYKYNKSFINSGHHVFSTNNTVSKALCRVWSGARFNGKAPEVLHENDTLPLFGSPWYNEAFTYAIYFYPNDSYKSELVCSPAVGNERHASGHRAEGVHWTFWDGYYFVRYNNGANFGNDSAVEKWTDKELETPGNQGVYDADEKKFTNYMYDPRVTKVVG